MKIDPSNFLKNMTAREQRTAFAVESYGKAVGNKMVKYAKRNARWTDRTHAARNTMNTTTHWQHRTLRVGLHQGNVDYFVFLEKKVFKHKGRLDIIFPTVERHRAEALQGWANRIKGVK